MSEQLKLGQIITEPQHRDAIHIAVVPCVAGDLLRPGDKVWLENGSARLGAINHIGVVDPFLTGKVKEGQTFWLFLNPGSITSLRHEWTHPAFPVAEVPAAPDKSASEKWMRAWAVEHMGYDYYGDGNDDRLSEERAYSNAIDAGRHMSVGPYESARDHIDNEWWTHWEAITGGRGQRGEYFSCGC